MRINLKDFKKISGIRKMDEVIWGLTGMKEHGIVFFTENLEKLDVHQTFTVYDSNRSDPGDDRIAFPIPIEQFSLPCNRRERNGHFNTFFSLYNKCISLDLPFTNPNIYVGYDFVWVYDRRKINGPTTL